MDFYVVLQVSRSKDVIDYILILTVVCYNNLVGLIRRRRYILLEIDKKKIVYCGVILEIDNKK